MLIVAEHEAIVTDWQSSQTLRGGTPSWRHADLGCTPALSLVLPYRYTVPHSRQGGGAPPQTFVSQALTPLAAPHFCQLAPGGGGFAHPCTGPHGVKQCPDPTAI